MVALGPVMNMERHPQGGRNWESFGADPYLTGESAYETVLGIQQAGVQACAKHYINKCVCEDSCYLQCEALLTVHNMCSEQEHKRTQESSHVDDRTEHGIYVHPFMRSVQACVASVMCSYSACEVSEARYLRC